MTKLLDDPPPQQEDASVRQIRRHLLRPLPLRTEPVPNPNPVALSPVSPITPVSPFASRDSLDRASVSISLRSRNNLLETSIREEPEDDDFRYVPMPTGIPSRGGSMDFGEYWRWRKRSSFSEAARDFMRGVADRDYGSFPFPLGQVTVSQEEERTMLKSPGPAPEVTPSRLAFIGIVGLILLLLTVGIIVEMDRDRHRNAKNLSTNTSSKGPSLRFPDLRRQVIRSKYFISSESQENAVYDLIERLLLPEEAAKFVISIQPGSFDDPATDTANITSSNTSVYITGNSGVACTFALYHFLKYHCGCQVSWSARQLSLPARFPVVSIIVRKADWLHYYQNVCTSSYSFVWWNWTRWEQEIDWMALQGINFPLAFTGQEEMWRRVYTALGLTDAELADFFVGPAFLAWGRMGNIFKWAGPLPVEWMSEQVELQRQILYRMTSLGMIPILPAFSGIVPAAIKRIHPTVNLTRLSNWAGFPDDMSGSYFLDPDDSLFKQLSDDFITEYRREFQYTSHFYNTDTFNEQRPANASGWDAQFIKRTAASTLRGMQKADPDAIWVMQAWMLVYDPEFWNQERTKALLTAVPTGRLLMLDLYAENFPAYNITSWFYGQPFIWCMLHNFGGVLGLYGRLSAVNTGPVWARSGSNSTMVGVGLSPEGIHQNDMMYEFMNEMSWRQEPADLDKWVGSYAARRYGGSLVDAERAYHVLQKSVFDCNQTFANQGRYTITRRPAFNLTEPTWYNPNDIMLALQLLLRMAQDVPGSGLPGLLYDVVDLTRQSLQNVFHYTYERFQSAYQTKHLENTALYGKALDMILVDMESILSLHPQFGLDKWAEDASSWARSENQSAFYQWNALNQITLWGPTGQIRDYATKQWSGVVSGYYQPRWELFVQDVISSLQSEKPFNQTAFDQLVFERVEEPFTHTSYQPIRTSSSHRFTVHNTVENEKHEILRVSEELHDKYRKYHTGRYLDSLKTESKCAESLNRKCQTESSKGREAPDKEKTTAARRLTKSSAQPKTVYRKKQRD